jgi:hypothetical protein
MDDNKPNPDYGRGTVYGKPLGVMMPKGSCELDGTPMDDPVCTGGRTTPAAIRTESLGRALPCQRIILSTLRAPRDGGEHDGIFDAM